MNGLTRCTRPNGSLTGIMYLCTIVATAMFDILAQRFSQIFRNLSGKGKLSEKDIDEALRQIRLALLEADVNFKVVKDFLLKVRARALDTTVLSNLTPVQQIVKIVNDELTSILGGVASHLTSSRQPVSVVMLVGLQGSGKTTTAAKLALYLKNSGQRALLVAADTRRPAAAEQLLLLGKQLDIPVYSDSGGTATSTICQQALRVAEQLGAKWAVIDTQGRLHIDEEMMSELVQLKKEIGPSEILLVVDALSGQDALNVAEEFNRRLGLTGLVLTKMDGDARGGAALSIKFITGVPIKFIGTGEKPDALEVFHPDRLASRILGMGDVLTLIEKAEKLFDDELSRQTEKKLRAASFDLDDLLWQLRQFKKMGTVSQLAGLVPGFSGIASKVLQGDEEQRLRRFEAIILSMTPEERRNPEIIDGSRRRRIARGSGTTPRDVNQLLSQYYQAKKLAKMVAKGKIPRGLFGL